MTGLDFGNDGMAGSIPAALGALDMLTTLDLRNNDLSGTVPAALGNLADTLTSLDLTGNDDLRGCIPDQFAGKDASNFKWDDPPP